MQHGVILGDNSQVTLLSNGATSRVTSLSVGANATLDITNNALVLDYSGDSPAGAIREKIVAGRGGSGLGKLWNGQGITSSTVAQTAATAPDSRSVAYAENAELPLGAYTSFRGQAVDSTTILIAYARMADANLDGVVENDDVTIVGANFSRDAAKPFWALGDFEYNGSVDDDDITLVGVFYNPAANPVAAPGPLAEGRPQRDNAPAFARPSGELIRDGSSSEFFLPVPAQGSTWKPTAATQGFAAVRSSTASSNDELIGLLAESIAADRAGPGINPGQWAIGYSPKT